MFCISDINQKKMMWAKAGLSDFRNGFIHENMRESLREGTVIGVYGPTQVGKTTLILKILGLSQEGMKEIASALRGGRMVGNSSTITATSYQLSLNNDFIIQVPGGERYEGPSLNEFTEMMKTIREKAQSNQIAVDKPVIIQIPQRYFDQEALGMRKHEIQIIDLPGDNSKDEEETEQVERCLKYFLPQCRVCIILEDAAQMLSLTQLKRSYVKDWTVRPLSFRIVLTRAVTSNSVKTKIKNRLITSRDEYYNEFLSQFSSPFEENDKQKAPKIKIYPLEYGDSWESMKNTDIDVHRIVKPWIEEVFEDLIKDLDGVPSIEYEIMQLRSMERYVRKIAKKDVYARLKEKNSKKAEEKRLEKENIRLREREKNLMEEIEAIKTYLEASEKELDGLYGCGNVLNEKMQHLTQACADERTVSWIKVQTQLVIEDMKKYYTSDLKEKIDKVAAKYQEKCDCSRVVGEKLSFDDVEEVDLNFLNKYTFNHYYLDFIRNEKKFEEDCVECKKKIRVVNVSMLQKMAEYIESWKIGLKQAVRIKIEELEKVISHGKKKCEENEKLRLNYQKTLCFYKEEVRKVIESWFQDREQLGRLDYFLKEHFIAEVEQIKAKISSTDTTKNEKWIYHQYWNVLVRDAERILSYEYEEKC